MAASLPRFPGSLPGRLPARFPGRLLARLPGKLPGRLPGRLPGSLPGRPPSRPPQQAPRRGAGAPGAAAPAGPGAQGGKGQAAGRGGRGGQRGRGAKAVEATPVKDRAPAGEGFTRLFISVGKSRGVYAKDLAALFSRVLEADRSRIGDIRVLDNYSFLEIDSALAEKAIAALSGTELKGRQITVNYARRKEEE